ncbi:tyrosine-type recombinase/integrase [Ktedonobacter racemifer]|uniref:Integrase family protein n=1 Tax=Ktedonobacter racemifer DSM 44963 TaxID=485913 RepID=D6U548_KTERA|nr:tyrosine-type recombinase/integrase [Ktedonobacter racemifer]EFH81628.1 integrase family protein [Ktedonobacter racemifer DSM 44963]
MTSQAARSLLLVNPNDANLINTWLHDKAQTTQRAYRRFAYEYLTALGKPFQMIAPLELKQYAMSLEGDAGTVAYRVNALKSLYSYATKLGYIQVNLGELLEAPKVRQKLAERILEEDEMLRLVAGETNPRNHATLRLMYHAGLRVSEIVSLKWENIHKTKSGGATLDVWGKGEEQRYVPISPSMLEELEALPGRLPLLTRSTVGNDRYVFQGRKSKGGSIPLDTRHVHRIVQEAAKRVGIEDNVSPHWFRHANASHSLDNGAPISVVQQSLGHKSLATTMKYLHVKADTGTSQYLKA